MATDKKISDLAVATTPSGAELIEIVQGGVNKQTTLQQIADLAGDEHFRGVFASEAALEAAVPTGNEGDYAFVDTGSVDAALYIWDDTDSDWLASGVTTVVPDAAEATKGIAELATQAETNTGTDDVRIVTPLKLHTKVVGVQDLYYPAFAGYPRATLGAFFANLEMGTSLVNLPVLAFQDISDKTYAQFQIVPPRKWNGGTITALPVWTAQSGSGTVRFEISGGMYRNDDALTVALGTAQNSDDTLLAVNDNHIGPETSAITLAGTFVSGGNLVIIQVARDPANDTLNANACLIGLIVRWTMTAAKDA